MNEATEHALLNAARAVHALADDLRGNTDTGTLGQTARNTLRAFTNAGEAVEKLAEDLRGYHHLGGGTTGDLLRAAIKRVGVKS